MSEGPVPTAAGAERYPVLLGLAGRRVLVVGGGRVAARRLPALLAAGADVVVVDPGPGAEVERLADQQRLTLRRRPVQPDDLDGAWFVQACTDDAAVNAAVAAEAERRRVWCVRADDAVAATAWTPASGTADGVTVAISAGGDPGRARAVRDAVLAGVRDGSLPARRTRGRHGRVALVGGGPGDPDLITVRGRRLLADADVVVTDRLGPRGLLAELPDTVEVVDVGKTPHTATPAQSDINDLLVRRARAGRIVVRLKGGDPFVFGRGGEELLACAAAGVECEVVPGVSSALAVPALAGIPLTHRGVAQEFVVVSGHLPPGHPRSTVGWPGLARSTATVVLLMAVEHLPGIAAALVAGGRPASTPVACIERGSTPAERIVISNLDAVCTAPAPVASPAVIVVGEVVGLHARTGQARVAAPAPGNRQTVGDGGAGQEVGQEVGLNMGLNMGNDPSQAT